MWKQVLNIEVLFDRQEWKTCREKMLNLDYDIGRSSWVGDYVEPSTFLDLFEYRTSGNNRTGWAHPDYTRLLHEAKRELDQQKRYELYSQAERLLIDAAPIIPIYHAISIYMVKIHHKGTKPVLSLSKGTKRKTRKKRCETL